MKLLSSAAVAALAVAATAPVAAAQERCFDKSTLTYVDCPAAPAPAPAPLPPAPSFTGFYVGAHGGFAQAFYDVTAGTGANFPTIGEFEADGMMLGAHVGYQHQFDSNIVLGVEIDGSYVFSADESIDSVGGTHVETATGDLDYLASARLKAGYAFGRFMPFATGGVALVGLDASYFDNEGAAADELQEFDDDVVAGVVGGGVEYLLTDYIVVRAQGEYYFVDETFGVTDPPISDAGAGDSIEVDGVWSARAGVSLKF